MDDRVAGGHEGVGSGKGVSPSPVGVRSGEGVCPSPEMFLISPLGMVHFGALFICLKVRSPAVRGPGLLAHCR